MNHHLDNITNSILINPTSSSCIPTMIHNINSCNNINSNNKYYILGILYRNIYLFLIVFIVFVIVLFRIGKVSFGELASSSINRIKYKVDKIAKYGFKSNLTYLYFDGNEKSIEKTVDIFLNTLDYLESINDPNLSIFKNNKLSLKLNQLGKTYEESLTNFETILNYARQKNILVWISAHMRTDLENEMNTYLSMREKSYTNIGLTLATYHNNINESIDKVLNLNGHVRLVKGYYNDGQIKDYEKINANYLYNAERLIKTNYYHQLATHDFNNIINLLYFKYELQNNNILEFGFFYNALGHVRYQIKIKNLKLNNKCCLIVFGNKFKYFKSNFKDISYKKVITFKSIL